MIDPAARWERLAGPTEPPVSLALLRQWCRWDQPEEDALLVSLAAAACAEVERQTQRGCGISTWRMQVPGFPRRSARAWDNALELLPGPLVAVESVGYYDPAGVWTLLDLAELQIDVVGKLGRIFPAVGTTWPPTQAGRVAAVEVIYRAGEWPLAEDLALCVRQLVAHWFREREAAAAGAVHVVPLAAQQLMRNAAAGVYL